ncbi:hypothetical protein DEH81_14825 [Pectobacterium zantedeschiae]|nr:hypothetical protein DEH81_14825 [Pectobacterium zantedeschiae]
MRLNEIADSDKAGCQIKKGRVMKRMKNFGAGNESEIHPLSLCFRKNFPTSLDRMDSIMD